MVRIGNLSAELFQILKDVAVKVLLSICQQIWKTQQWPQNWQSSVFIPIPKAMSRNAQTTAQLHTSHTLVKQCSKFSKPGFNSTWTMNFQMFSLDLEEAEEPEIKLLTFVWSSKSKRVPEKTYNSALLTVPKTLSGSQQTLGKSSRDGNTRPPDLPLEKPVCRSRSNSYSWTWNNRLVPNRKRSMSRLYIVTLLI